MAILKNSGHLEIIKGYQISTIPIELNSTHREIPFDMSHDTVWVTFSFCASWPRYTPRADLYSLRPFIWYVTQCAAGNFLILHLMTPEHPRAKFYLSRRFIWYITWYLFGNLFILQLMTPVYPKAKLYSSRPFIWHVTRYHLGNFLILHSMTPVYPWAELCSSRPSSSYVVWWPFGSFSFCT